MLRESAMLIAMRMCWIFYCWYSAWLHKCPHSAARWSHTHTHSKFIVWNLFKLSFNMSNRRLFNNECGKVKNYTKNGRCFSVKWHEHRAYTHTHTHVYKHTSRKWLSGRCRMRKRVRWRLGVIVVRKFRIFLK